MKHNYLLILILLIDSSSLLSQESINDLIKFSNQSYIFEIDRSISLNTGEKFTDKIYTESIFLNYNFEKSQKYGINIMVNLPVINNFIYSFESTIGTRNSNNMLESINIEFGIGFKKEYHIFSPVILLNYGAFNIRKYDNGSKPSRSLVYPSVGLRILIYRSLSIFINNKYYTKNYMIDHRKIKNSFSIGIGYHINRCLTRACCGPNPTPAWPLKS